MATFKGKPELNELEGRGAGAYMSRADQARLFESPSGPRFGTTSTPYLNKPAKRGLEYRSPEQTNANSLVPNLNENVIASQRADIARMLKARSANETPKQQRDIDLSKVRAASRTATRAALAAGAGKAAYDGAKEDEGTEETKASKPRAEEEEAPKERRKYSVPTTDAKERIAEDKAFRENEKALQEVDAEIESEKYGKGDKYAKGGSVSASRRGDGIAQRGKTRGKMC